MDFHEAVEFVPTPFRNAHHRAIAAAAAAAAAAEEATAGPAAAQDAAVAAAEANVALEAAVDEMQRALAALEAASDHSRRLPLLLSRYRAATVARVAAAVAADQARIEAARLSSRWLLPRLTQAELEALID